MGISFDLSGSIIIKLSLLCSFALARLHLPGRRNDETEQYYSTAHEAFSAAPGR